MRGSTRLAAVVVLLVWSLGQAVPVLAAPGGPAGTAPAPVPAPQVTTVTNNTTVVQEKWQDPPQSWIATAINAGLAAVLRVLVTQLHDVVQAALGSTSNFVTRTPPGSSYGQGAIVDLWGTLRAVANASLVVILAWGGLGVLVREGIGASYHEAMVLFPRVAVAAVLVNTSLLLARRAIDLSNALCALVMPAAGIPGWGAGAGGPDVQLLSLLALLAYLLVVLLLVIQLLLRLALVDVCIVLAPLALACWALPQTQGWTRTWSKVFLAAVVSQFVQVTALRIGSAFITGAADGASPVLQLFLGIGAVWLAYKVPALLDVQLGSGAAVMRVVVQRVTARPGPKT